VFSVVLDPCFERVSVCVVGNFQLNRSRCTMIFVVTNSGFSFCYRAYRQVPPWLEMSTANTALPTPLRRCSSSLTTSANSPRARQVIAFCSTVQQPNNTPLVAGSAFAEAYTRAAAAAAAAVVQQAVNLSTFSTPNRARELNQKQSLSGNTSMQPSPFCQIHISDSDIEEIFSASMTAATSPGAIVPLGNIDTPDAGKDVFAIIQEQQAEDRHYRLPSFARSTAAPTSSVYGGGSDSTEKPCDDMQLDGQPSFQRAWLLTAARSVAVAAVLINTVQALAALWFGLQAEALALCVFGAAAGLMLLHSLTLVWQLSNAAPLKAQDAVHKVSLSADSAVC
jgi:hypothetical protein